MHYLHTDNMATFLLEFRIPRHQQEHPHGQTDGRLTPTRKEIYHPLKNAFILKVKISFYINELILEIQNTYVFQASKESTV